MSTTEPMLVKRSTVSRYPFMSRARLTIREHAFITLIAQRYEVDYSRALRIVLRDAIERLGEPERAALEAAAVAVADELNRTVAPDSDPEPAPLPLAPPAKPLSRPTGATVTLRRPDDDANGTTRVRIRSSRAT